jgi:hypothetical protein
MVFSKKKSLKALIQNSLGSKFFRSIYFNVSGKPKDILENGNLSCAFYVSVILKILGLISEIHTTVKSIISDLEKSGWQKTKKPAFGAVIVWEPAPPKSKHYHIGFCLNSKKAVSNSSKKRCPIIHDINYQNRKIKAIYKFKELV